MTPKPASANLGASDQDASALSPGDADGDVAAGLETAKPAGESYDDSLEAILLQAGARPPEPAASKLLGSKTLMGLGIEGLNLASIRAAAEARSESQGRSDSTREDGEAAIQIDEATHQTGTSQSEDKEVTSLLDEVAQALNVQASEYRDRARGRLPGMPSPATAPGRVAGQAMVAPGANEAEFEDPDDVPTSLTPGIISVVDEHDEVDHEVSLDVEDQVQSPGQSPGEDRAQGRTASETQDEAVVLAASEPAGSGKAKDTKSLSRPGAVPPVPGLTLGTAPPPVGPPPGLASRAPTPAAGLAAPPISGRVRLPTPAPGLPVPTLPAPALGRLTLPLGIVSPPGSAQGGTDLTATAPSTPIALEASRRTPGSGRVSTRRSARITEQVVPVSSSLPGILTAHVKLATVSLAGLIAVTFAGGLFVGMLVWKGQGRGEQGSTARMAATNAGTVPSATGTTPAGVAPVAGATTPTTGAAATNARGSSPAVAGLPTEAVVTPLPPGSAEATPLATSKPVRRQAVAARPRRPPPTPTVADTAALFPKSAAGKPAARTVTGAGATASKPVATNAAQKPVVKSKAKSTWHDPFAD